MTDAIRHRGERILEPALVGSLVEEVVPDTVASVGQECDGSSPIFKRRHVQTRVVHSGAGVRGVAGHVAPGHTPEAVAKRLRADQSVVYVLWVAGRYDLMVEVVSDDRESFLRFLETQIHGATDIADAEIMLGLRNFKNQFLLKREWEDRHG